MHPAGSAVSSASYSAASSIGSLLVVDDSPVQRLHAVALCQELGVQMIYEASSGIEALELLAMLHLSPDVLIVDLEMPGMDGIELIQQLQQRQFSIPLIVASGREYTLIESVEAMARNLGLPVLGGMQKPLNAQTLQLAFDRFGQIAGTAPEMPAAKNMPTASADMLAAAIAAGDIKVHYQPKVDMRTGIVRGVEALARWQLPEAGFVPPDYFIALAEREGLIHGLTFSVMKQALAQAAEWNAHGLRLSMAINLSPRLLDQSSLVDEVSALALRFGLAPSQIILEITETSMVAYLGAALGVLARLRLKGFGLSIDDYGSGFSSMQQLARIPFTELKVDRSFVHGAHLRANLRVILQSALDMARRLDLVTVAEGIETLADWRLLQESGCGIGQGYLIARPMPAADMPQWLKLHQSRLHELRIDAIPSFRTDPQ
jgi:EAL domain-containing protein (putative c-di-GMP-specific phosphodiesterase class I)/FixJ family two-component response regulator